MLSKQKCNLGPNYNSNIYINYFQVYIIYLKLFSGDNVETVILNLYVNYELFRLNMNSKLKTIGPTDGLYNLKAAVI